MPSFTHRFHSAAPRHRRSATVGLIATLLFLAGAIPAQATVVEHEQFSFSDSFPDVICGVSVRHDQLERGVAHFRAGNGDLASTFFELSNHRFVETLTNEANGNFVQIEHNELIHDVKATHVSGSIFIFRTIYAGQPILIRDMTGHVVSRDRGVLRETSLFDTLGDDTPGGVYLEQLDLLVSGPHPLLPGDFNEEAFCAIVRPLLVGF